jgi:hypothetical protein
VARRPRPLTLAKRRQLAAELEASIGEGPHDSNLMAFFTGWTDKQIKLQVSFERFDVLPPSLRRALYESTVTFEPEPVLEWWLCHGYRQNRRPVDAAKLGVRMIRDAERADLLDFASIYRRRYRTVLPHLAAQATILRYDKPRRRRKRITSELRH